MLVQGHNLKLPDEARSRYTSSTWDQKARTLSTSWVNLGGLSLKMGEVQKRHLKNFKQKLVSAAVRLAQDVAHESWNAC